MRITAITDEVSQDLSHALSVLKDYGCTSAELRNVYGTYIVDADNALIDRVYADLARAEMTLDCLDTPLFKCDLDRAGLEGVGATHNAKERTLQDQWGLLDHCLALAHRLDTPFIRIFAFWRKGELTPVRRQEIIRILGLAAAIAGQAHKTLLLENEHACLLGTAAETVSVIREVNSPWLRFVWDPGNALMLGEPSLPDGYNVAKNYLSHIHIKDVTRDVTGHGSWACVGDGDGQYAALLSTLALDGYTGSIALETHWKSADQIPETASRLCLDRLFEMLQ